MNYKKMIKEKLKEIHKNQETMAKDLNYDPKTIYNYLKSKTKDMGFQTLQKILNYINANIDIYNLQDSIYKSKLPPVEKLPTKEILTQYIEERIKINECLNFTDINIESLKNKIRFLYAIQNLENKYRADNIFEVANYAEFEFLWCMFKSPNLKKWVNDLQNEFKSIAKCKTESNIKDINTYINEKCKNMTEKEKEEYLLKYSGNKEKYGEEVARQIKIARANIDEINHKFFQKLFNEFYESEYME